MQKQLISRGKALQRPRVQGGLDYPRRTWLRKHETEGHEHQKMRHGTAIASLLSTDQTCARKGRAPFWPQLGSGRSQRHTQIHHISALQGQNPTQVQATLPEYKLQLATIKLLQGNISKGLERKHESSSLANQKVRRIQREVFQLNQLPHLNQFSDELQSGRIVVDDSTKAEKHVVVEDD